MATLAISNAIGGLSEGTTVSATVQNGVLAGDTDPFGFALAVSAVSHGNQSTNISGGTATLGGAYGSLTMHADGSYSYAGLNNLTFPADGILQDQFAFSVTDGHGNTGQATLTITVTQPGVQYIAAAAGQTVVIKNAATVVDASLGGVTVIGGNGNIVVIGGANDKITLGNGNDWIIGGSNETISVGNGADVISVGDGATIAAGNGNDAITAGANSTVTAGKGTNTITLGPGSTLAGGKVVVPTLTAPASLSVDEDGAVALPISATSSSPSEKITVTISGIPADAHLSNSAGALTVANGSIVLTQAQLAGLTLTAGEVTSAVLSVTAIGTSAGGSLSASGSIALTVTPVAPSLTLTSQSLSVNAGGTVALGISETPFDPRDNVALTVTGVPSDASLSAGSQNSDGSWSLTPAQLSGLMLQSGATSANLTITATNTLGATASTSQSLGVTVVPAGVPIVSGSYAFTSIDDPGGLTYAKGLNDKGEVVGIYLDANGVTHGFIDDAGVFTTLDDPSAANIPGAGTIPAGITNAGEIVGTYVDANFVNHGFTDIAGVFTSFEDPLASPAHGTAVYGVNDSGDIVGGYTANNESVHGFLLDGSGFHTIDDPSPGASLNAASGLNDFGEIAGSYWVGGVNYGFLDVGGAFTTVVDPSFNPAMGSWLSSINNLGQMVGGYFDDNGVRHGFIYDGEIFTTVDVPSSSGTQPTDINNLGQIVGQYTDSQGTIHGFLATPAVTVPAGATFEITAPSADYVTFAGSTGKLQLDQSQSFIGTVAGFGAQDQIDLADISFGPNTTLDYVANASNTDGTLTASDGVHTTKFTLVGLYTGLSFAPADDGHGGTMITDPPVSGRNLLASLPT
jgi:VCBS repeat-containing protein